MWIRQSVRFFSVNNSPRPKVVRSSKKWEHFGTHWLFTNTWTSGILMVAGDLIQQEIECRKSDNPKRYDWARVGRMFIAGLGLGPIHHYFYGWMDKKLPYRTMSSITGKILLDQFIMSPCCIVFLFYSTCLMERKTIRESTAEVNQKFMKVYLMDWCVWPAAQFINFYYLPSRYQVLYINGVTTIYNIFLSYIKHEQPRPIKNSEEHCSDNSSSTCN